MTYVYTSTRETSHHKPTEVPQHKSSTQSQVNCPTTHNITVQNTVAKMGYTPLILSVRGGAKRVVDEMDFPRRYSVIFTVLLLFAADSEAPNVRGITVVVLGSTGDLAKRYIWPALFDIFRTPSTGYSVAALYAAVRHQVDDDKSFITANVDCFKQSNAGECWAMAKHFSSFVQVVQLEGLETYASLSDTIEHYLSQNKIEEVGRLFYLAVPPFAYPSIVEKISNQLRPVSKSTLIHVIFEKPFGHDIHSAKQLSEDVMQFLTNEEIYLIDHYLGKPGAQEILSFRKRNSLVLEDLWNRNGIEHIEISVKETVGLEGRSHFYDKYGVICDVMQNHLTELFVQVTVNMDDGDYLSSKNRLLSRVYPPRLQGVLLGQYSTYISHLDNDGVVVNALNESKTPTFAAVALHLRDPKWIGVPFILISGKQLNTRSAYVKIVFKKFHFTPLYQQNECESSIIFLIQSEVFMQPGVLISEDLINLSLVSPEDNWIHEEVMYEDCPHTFLHSNSVVETNPYVKLLRDAFNSHKKNFVQISSLLHSWKVWSPLLSEIHLRNPPVYSYDATHLEQLAFRLSGTQISPLFPKHMEWGTILHSVSDKSCIGKQRISVVSNTYAGISNMVAQFLSKEAIKSVTAKGSFHIAVPGGSSPLGLFQSLVLDHWGTIPWSHTHLWFTDERCVSWNNSESNFLQLSDHLISLAPIPFVNIHPMPVLLHSGYCVTTDRGTELYERELKIYADGEMDIVVLGLGKDGHIASLFPMVAVKEVIGSGVQIQQLVNSYTVHTKRRMTLSLDTILKAKTIVLLVSGEGKETIYNTLLDCLERNTNSDVCALPVVELATRVKHKQFLIYRSLL